MAASPFRKATSTGYTTFAVPADIRSAFEDAVGPVLPRRTVNLPELERWAVFFFGGAGDAVALARKVACEVFEFAAASEGVGFVESWEPWKLIAVLAEVGATNGPLFRRVMKASGCWKEGVPACRMWVEAERRDAEADPIEPVAPPVLPPPPVAGASADANGGLAALVKDLYAVVEQQKAEIASLHGRLSGLPAANLSAAAFEGPAGHYALPVRYSLKDVREWADVAASDPHGLVRDLHSEYVAGYVGAPGGAFLKASFEKLKTWILGVAAGSAGWSANEELVRLGNELLLDVRLNYGWCVEKVPRSRMLREMEAESGDLVERLMAKVKGDLEKEKNRTPKWNATPAWKKGKGGKGGKVPLEVETETVLAAVRRALDADHLLPSDRSDQNPTTGPSRESGRTNSSQFPASSLGVADVLKPSARAASVIGQAIHELVASKTGVGISRALAARHKENGVSVAEAHRRLQQAVGRAWASSTVDDRRNMWRRFQAWASGRGLGLNPDVAVLFVVATSVEPQGMLGYSRLLSAVFGHMGVDSKPLKVLASVLRGDGASIPLSQAEGIPRETLISWARRQVPHLRLAAFVAWKTASRWAEVRLLTRPCFVLVSTTEVIIDWGTLPKGRSRNPYCLSKTAVIRGALTEEIAALVRGAGNFSPLTPVTTSQLDGMWAREPRMCRYSAHSIKRGAVDHLVCAKAAGAPFPEHLISRLAKHTADNVDPTLAQMTTRLPKTEDEKASPLHVDNVRPMNVGLLRGRMNETTRARFDETWRRTFDVAKLRPSSSRRVSRLQAKHAEELEMNGIAQRASGPGRSVNVPFTVVEEKEGALRQRFILWTHEANDAIEADGYEAQVPLKHVSTYLDAVHAECGSTRDLRCGFYGVEVPRGARDAFRFQDDAGDWWELTRLPMGHTCAPELMHTLTSTIAGHPDFVKTVHAVPAAVTVHTWVDNVRYAGSRKDVLEASRKVDELAARSKVTWKDADTRTASTRYEFIGVDWDHQSGKVGISARLSKKLARDLVEVRKGAMSASGLETLGGRLLHASAIVGVFVGEFYFALKFLRRLTNALNRGEKAVDQTVRLSGSVQRLLDGWVRAVLEKRRMPVTARVPSLTVFVDASLEGWGGVLVDVATNAIEVLGSRWSRKEKGLHINELEALAFELCVSAVPDKYAGGTVTVVVDNTTVQGVARKGASSPFRKATTTGYTTFAVPADVRSAFEDAVGPVLPRRTVNLPELERWAVFFFGGAGDAVALARKVACEVFEFAAASEGLGFVESWEPWKLIAVLAEVGVTNGPLFRRVMKASGCWKEGVPACRMWAEAERRDAEADPIEPVAPPVLPPPPVAGASVDASGGLAALVKDLYAVVEQQKAEIASLHGRLSGLPAANLSAAAFEGPAGHYALPVRYSLKDVREWADVAASDPHGLVRDLHSEYVAGYVGAPGGAFLKASFEKLKTWILGVAAGSAGWSANEELVRLGNELLLDVRLNYGWCVEKVPRSRMLREMEAESGDLVERLMAKVKGDLEKEKNRTPKWNATPAWKKGKGGKGGKSWYGQGNGYGGK
ncbi:hypothetical protein DIPPA_11328 [Diplonema papillatum]|nr:hypothetical protein DIPPA_11328 [Diplonema papillatum]